MADITRRRFLLTTTVAGPGMVGLSAKGQGLLRREHLPVNALATPKAGSISDASASPAEAAESPAHSVEQIFKELKRLPYLRTHLRWQVGFTQHTMYMLIDEDRGVPMVGERHMPWGAPDASVYLKRTLHNMEALGEIPQFRLNYDYPACDIESIAARFPDLMAKMQEMHRRGALDFVNGTYSSPHLQILSSESNWRQFEYGLPVFKKLFNKEVKLYAFQEVSQHVQLPQILAKFGYKMLCMGAMPWAMEIIEGPFVFQSDYRATQFVHGNQFVEAVALDGTSLPAYLMQPTGPRSDRPDSDENVKACIDDDLYGPSPIWPYFPDDMEVPRQLYDEISALLDFVLLEKALDERAKIVPPRAKARVFSYWSYAEGVWAEELLRTNREAEQAAILAEAIQAMGEAGGLGLDRSEEINAIWHKIIKYQNHDVSWIEVTDLRRKAINYLNDGRDKCQQIMESLTKRLTTHDSHSLAIFNGLPLARNAMIEVPGKTGLGGGPPLQEFQGKSFGVRELPAGGYRSFPLAEGDSVPSKEVPLPKEITTAHYAVTFSENGLMAQIGTQGRELLSSARYLGGELKVMIDERWVDNRSARCRFYEGPVAYILVRTSTLGEVPLVERYFFLRKENVIRVELEFDFKGETWGRFWFDETKLNVYYPTTNSEIYYDIPFGYVTGGEGLPLFATSWLYCGGVVYVNWGTVKHWVKDGVLANVLAWGGNVFTNRLQFDWSQQAYDIRLYGKQRIKYALIPYGGFSGNGIVQDVAALTSPGFISQGGGGRSFFAIEDKDLAVTSIYWKDGQIWARGYQLPVPRVPRYRDWEIFNAPIKEVHKRGS